MRFGWRYADRRGVDALAGDVDVADAVGRGVEGEEARVREFFFGGRQMGGLTGHGADSSARSLVDDERLEEFFRQERFAAVVAEDPGFAALFCR